MSISQESPVRFGVVGTGWRAGFFVRLAKLRPDLLQIAGVVSRNPERARELGWGTKVFTTVDELVAEVTRLSSSVRSPGRPIPRWWSRWSGRVSRSSAKPHPLPPWLP